MEYANTASNPMNYAYTAWRSMDYVYTGWIFDGICKYSQQSNALCVHSLEIPWTMQTQPVDPIDYAYIGRRFDGLCTHSPESNRLCK